MNEVMLSVRPKWCELIASGEKTADLRKTRPNRETPFKCYLYCTKDKNRLIEVIRDGYDLYGEIYHGKNLFIKVPSTFSIGWSEKVIGEFVCDEIAHLDKDSVGYNIPYCDGTIYFGDADIPEKYKNWRSCVSVKEADKYFGIKRGYLWHISELTLYKVPRPLSDFGMKRPPQSWCYVRRLAYD